MVRTLGLIVVGVLAGTWLAALPLAANDLCDFFNLPEGSGAGGTLSWWPTGTVCHYHLPDGSSRTTFHRASELASVAWIAVVGALFSVSRLRRLAEAAVVLGIEGFAYHFAGDWTPAMIMSLIVAIPVIGVIDRSAVTGFILTPVVLFAWSVVSMLGYDHLALVAGIAAGGVVQLTLTKTTPLSVGTSAKSP